MELSHSLLDAIESAHVAFQGLSHPLRFAGVQPDPPAPMDATSAIITVETTHEGEVYRAQCRIDLNNVDDEAHVVEALAGAMRAALTGDPPSGEGRVR